MHTPYSTAKGRFRLPIKRKVCANFIKNVTLRQGMRPTPQDNRGLFPCNSEARLAKIVADGFDLGKIATNCCSLLRQGLILL